MCVRAETVETVYDIACVIVLRRCMNDLTRDPVDQSLL